MIPNTYELREVPPGVVHAAAGKGRDGERYHVPGTGAPWKWTDKQAEDFIKWSGEIGVPEIGWRVHVIINDLGPGEVCGYFIEHGWLGVEVALLTPPDWYVKQNGDSVARVFGAEIGPPVKCDRCKDWATAIVTCCERTYARRKGAERSRTSHRGLTGCQNPAVIARQRAAGKVPPCVSSMGCLCAGHARGNPATVACDTREEE